MTAVTADQLATLPGAGQQIPLDDWNILIRAVQQLLEQSAGSVGPQNTTQLIVGTEIWTIAGFKDGGDRRFLLMQVGDVDDVTTATAHFSIILQQHQEVT